MATDTEANSCGALRLTAGTIGAHSFVKAKVKQWEQTEREFAPRRTHLIEKRGVRRGVVPAHVTPTTNVT
jgi:hypothetical protein